MLAPEAAAVTCAMGAAAKLSVIIDRAPPIDSADPSGLTPEKVVGEIGLKDVKFSYPTRPDVQAVKGVSLFFRAGETTALVGVLGCGKSTIIFLIERFYDPSSGAIELDHTDIKDLDAKWLRSQIGLVSQGPVLFSMSIRENARMGLTGAPLEKVNDEEEMAAVKEACMKTNADGPRHVVAAGIRHSSRRTRLFALWWTEAADFDRQGDSLEPAHLTSE